MDNLRTLKSAETAYKNKTEENKTLGGNLINAEKKNWQNKIFLLLLKY